MCASALRVPVPIILGPTGVGKSRAAFEVARRLGGEIVVADSRQVYQQLDIATNKPSPADRTLVAYHMIDFADPRRRLSVQEWAEGAAAAIAGIAARGHLPIVEGGSSLYVDVLADGFNLAGVPPRPERRLELERLDVARLAQLLDQLDPQADVDRRNPVRLVRAVEILESAGPPLSRHRRRQPPGWDALRIGLQVPLEVVDERLRLRSLEQVRRGLVEETRRALEDGVPDSAGVLSGIGYHEALAHLRGDLSLDQLPQAMAAANRRYARRQLRWLRRDGRVHWIDAVEDPVPAILGYLEKVLA